MIGRSRHGAEPSAMSDGHFQPDTIVAQATAPGVGAIAVVRLSGPRSLEMLKRCFQPIGRRRNVNNFSHRKMVLGDLAALEDGRPVDRVLAVYMRAPHSYTGEDVVEIHCHGSPAVVARIIEIFRRLGARPAEPGEFTRRAFLNGRIDLPQAEAVADLVRSATAEAARLALGQLAGRLSERIEAAREELVSFAAEVEARLDFPEEEIEPADREALGCRLACARSEIEDLLRQGRRGRVFREGARIVIVGRPNVGKSSLLNALIGRERAIVSPHPGTTRDTIECTVDLGGVAATFVDTAGWRDARDEIERMGVERTEGEMAVADLLVWVVDASAELTDEDRSIAERIRLLPTVVACNKSDLPPAVERATIQQLGFDAGAIVSVSALRREGIEELEKRMWSALFGRDRSGAPGETPLVSNARHLALLERAREAVVQADRAFAEGRSGDLVMVDIRRAIGALDEILGRRFDQELLDRIFSQFCIGK